SDVCSSDLIGTIELTIDAEGQTKLSWTTSKIAIRSVMASCSHQLDSFKRFECTNQHSVRSIVNIGYDVELVVHAIDEINICGTANAVHRLGAFSATATKGVRCSVFRSSVSFRLYDYSGHTRAIRSRDYEKFA